MQYGSHTHRRLINGDEQDACTGWKKFLLWHPGERHKTKRKINKRERREGHDEAERELRDATSPDRPHNIPDTQAGGRRVQTRPCCYRGRYRLDLH